MKRLMRPLALLGTAMLGVLILGGCQPAGPAIGGDSSPSPSPTTEATPTPEPTPTPTPEPTPEPIDTTAQVSILGYHRFEDPARDPLAITSQMFREQLQAIKDSDWQVISMADFLAWRRGEKNIPPQSVVITIDDGYVSCYTKAWPILKEFGYPFTMFVYTDYIGVGGKSISWQQLEEMRDAGVEIGSHSISHDHMVRPKRKKANETYESWLHREFVDSKHQLEDRLGIEVRTFAYPFGVHNEAVAQKGLASGYEALFTVNGQKVRYDSPAGMLGRYVVQSDKPFTFQNALKSSASSPIAVRVAAAGQPTAAGGATTSAVTTQPQSGETISDPLPEIRADLSALGAIDPKSVEMRLSGFGIVPAVYDPESKTVSYKMQRRLRNPTCTVIVSASAGGRKTETRWTFNYDPQAAKPVAPEAAEPSSASQETP